MGAEPGPLIERLLERAEVNYVAAKENDVVVLHLKDRADAHEMQVFLNALRDFWPDNPVVVVDAGAQLSIFEWE